MESDKNIQCQYAYIFSTTSYGKSKTNLIAYIITASDCAEYPVDMVFILDVSPPSSHNWQAVVRFVSDMVSELHVGEHNSHVAVVAYTPVLLLHQ